LGQLGVLTAKQKFENPTKEIVGYIKEMLKASKREFENHVIVIAIVQLEKIGMTAAENNLKNVITEVATILNEILEITKECDQIDKQKQAKESLGRINEALSKI
jgi:hypothetical protein